MYITDANFFQQNNVCSLKLPTHSVMASLPSSEKASCLSEAWKIISKAQGNAKIQYIVWKVLSCTKYGHTTSDSEKCLPSWFFFSFCNYFFWSSLSACKCVCVCVHACIPVCLCGCMCMDVCVPFTFSNSLKPAWTCNQYEQVQFNTGDQNTFDRS